MPRTLAPPGPAGQALHQLHAQLSRGQSCHRQKSLAPLSAGSLQSCPTLRDPGDCGLPVFSVREGAFSRQEHWSVLANAGCHTPLEHCIPAALAANPPGYPVLPEPLRPKQLPRLITWPHRGKPKSSRAASGADPSGRPTFRGGNKTTIETQGPCG